MKRYLARSGTVLALVASMLLGLFSPVAAMAETTDCIGNFGTKVPALMVHGWDGDERVWDSMKVGLKTLGGVAPDTFNYRDVHDQWVTDPAIGRKLAERIDCLSRASLKGKGSGKVVIIAHSMGGLAARYAANQTVDGRKVAEELGLVITLGTPHTGSLWGNMVTAGATSVCQGLIGNLMFNPILGLLMTKDMCLANLAIKGLSKDSRELQELLRFPANVPMKAIAGHLGARIQAFGFEVGIDTKGDLVVGVDSATAEYTSTGVGDGMFIFECEGYVSSELPCSHNGLPQAEQVQVEVKHSIENYLAAARGKLIDFYGLELRLGSNWKVHSEAAFGRMMIDTSRCVKLEGKEWCSGFTVYDREAVSRGSAGGPDGLAVGHCGVIWAGGDAELGYVGSRSLPGRKVGSELAEYFEADSCSGFAESFARIWNVPGKEITISSFEFRAHPLGDLDKVLEQATWR